MNFRETGILVALLGSLLASGASGAERQGAGVGHQKMLDLLKEIRNRTPAENPYFGDARRQMLRKALGELPSDASLAQRGEAMIRLATAELNSGEERKAIDLLEKAMKALEEFKGGPEAMAELNFRLGFAWLRLAESTNCCLRHDAESCIVPIRGGGIHTEKAASEKAIAHFRKSLDLRSRNIHRHMQAQWLLNVAYMTLGRYPDGVPADYRIKPEVFQSSKKLPRFRNIAPELGIHSFNLAGGMIVDDFDGDEDLDVITSSFDTAEALRYFENRGDRSFRERSKEAGFTGLFGGLNLAQADYDNDGDLDVLILRGGWFGPQGRHPNSLLRNDGKGVFEDVTFAAGLGDVHYPTQTADWADFDNDGDLDLFVGNETSRDVRAPCQLFRNNGDGTFEDIATQAGVENFAMTKGVAWGDFDHDRWPDLAISNFGSPNRLYRNKGDGTFIDVTEPSGVGAPVKSFPVWFWDYDNDGHLDLFIASYAAKTSDLMAHYLGLPSRLEPPGHYRGDGAGRFKNVSKPQGLDYPMLPMGSNFGDLDNDGFLDLYLGTGEPDISTVMPNVMFLNEGGKRFVDVTMSGGFGHLQKGHAVCFADFDHDGDQDVFEQMGGARPVDKYADALYENPGLGGKWMMIRLVGNKSNRWGIGGRIHVRLRGAGGERSIYRHVNSGGSFGANPLRQHIGLGDAEEILKLEVFWPTTGVTQVVDESVPLNSYLLVREGGDAPEALQLK